MSSKNKSETVPGVEVTQRTLRDEEIETTRGMGRRTAMAAIGAAVLGTGAVASTGCYVTAPGPVYGGSGITDSDSGQWADPAGNGRGGYRGVATGLTDGDSGTYSDPAGQGRGTYGRGQATGLTDADSGQWADPAGNGRGTARLANTGITDGDGGPYADPAGGGRGHR